jgi:hypothetical protein
MEIAVHDPFGVERLQAFDAGARHLEPHEHRQILVRSHETVGVNEAFDVFVDAQQSHGLQPIFVLTNVETLQRKHVFVLHWDSTARMTQHHTHTHTHTPHTHNTHTTHTHTQRLISDHGFWN